MSYNMYLNIFYFTGLRHLEAKEKATRRAYMHIRFFPPYSNRNETLIDAIEREIRRLRVTFFFFDCRP